MATVPSDTKRRKFPPKWARQLPRGVGRPRAFGPDIFQACAGGKNWRKHQFFPLGTEQKLVVKQAKENNREDYNQEYETKIESKCHAARTNNLPHASTSNKINQSQLNLKYICIIIYVNILIYVNN